MKVNTRNKVLFRKYTGRINILFAIAFVITFISAYVDYLNKEVRQGPLPWYRIFFKAQQYSWFNAAPFDK
jgi:hypothetical protein